MKDLITIQKQLVSVIAPSGKEKKRAEIISDMVSPYVDEVFKDVMGNLYAHKRGNGCKVMVAAHMDTLGFVVEHIDSTGYLKVFTIGGIPVYGLGGKRLIFESGAVGTICAEQKAEIQNKNLRDVRIGHYYVDIGAQNREEAEKMVSIGCCAVYSIPPTLLGDDVLLSSYCDDLMGCAAVIHSIQNSAQQPLNDMYYVFTVQEEVGCRGAQPAAERIRPDIGVVVEVVGAEDAFSRKKDPAHLLMGSGPVLRAYDSKTIYDAALLSQISETGRKIGYPCQVKYSAGGSNDASVIQRAGTGARLACLCMATRYIHTQAEMLSLRDVLGVSKILSALAEESFDKDGE